MVTPSLPWAAHSSARGAGHKETFQSCIKDFPVAATGRPPSLSLLSRPPLQAEPVSHETNQCALPHWDAARDQQANLHPTPEMSSVTGPSNSLMPLAIIPFAAEIKAPHPSHAARPDHSCPSAYKEALV